MNYWLMKTEPNTFSWDDLVNKGRDHWDGVRNYAARKHMMEMKADDLALFYHSVNEKSIVGIAKIVKEHYPDPTTDDDRWVVVDLAPERKLTNPVTLDVVKADSRLTNMVLVNNSRLSVQPVTEQEFKIILELSAQ
ncbi:EVE domain-containing protein [Reichenbachiella agarivorans]|uniref:EVE domain-containing protein n=1 Tax=Reichenbachiella agarivorans TaxID=2979464 RepID=A0ABY6CNV1_9BACT|nr:EVE domain-containing protein [Reichenbachiella agarivorans]UXP31033.1 EVE domain-containing protein [Reichenbachiella agarivorans]